MNLLEACYVALKNSYEKIDNPHQADVLFSKLEAMFPFTSWGRIDWEKVPQKIIIQNSDTIIPLLEKHKKDIYAPVYIMWDDANVPIIKSSIKPIIQNIEHVTAVSFDTWILCPTEGWVIEFFHDGKVTLGFRPVTPSPLEHLGKTDIKPKMRKCSRKKKE